MKKMQAAAILTAMILCTHDQLSAQCKYVKAQKDEWTNKTYNLAQMAIGTPLAMREIILYEDAKKYNIGLRITFNTDFAEVPFKKGDKVNIKLENNEIIEITASKDLVPVLFRVADVPLRMWYVNQEFTAAEFEKLSLSPIKAIRFKLNDIDHDLPGIKEKQTIKLMETAKCMLETYGR